MTTFRRVLFEPKNYEQSFFFNMCVHEEMSTVVPIRSEDESVVELLRFGTSDDAEVVVNVARLMYEMNPADWLDLYLEKKNIEVVETDVWSSPAGIVCDPVIRYDDGSLGKMRTVKDGDRMFLITARSKPGRWSEFGDSAQVMLNSFGLTNPTKQVTAEPVKPYSVDSLPQGSFVCPASWENGTKVCQTDEAVFYLDLVESVSMGRIIVHLARESDQLNALTLAQMHSQRLQAMGFHVGGAPLAPAVNHAGQQACFDLNLLARYNESDFDARARINREGGIVGLVGLLSPARNASPELWAINKRAFEIVRDSLSQTA